MAERYLSTSEMLNYLNTRHGVRRSHDWANKAAAKGKLVPDDYEGPYRRYSPRSVDVYVARKIRSNQPMKEGIPAPEEIGTETMSRKDLTSRTFAGIDAGQATLEKQKGDFLKDGRNRDVGEQNADVAQPGRTGHRDGQNNAGKKFAESGPAVPGNKSSVGISAPARAGRTGNTEGEAANASRGSRRSKTRDYSKEDSWKL
jgi:hypothetical protein